MSLEQRPPQDDESLFFQEIEILHQISAEYKRLYFLTTGSPDAGIFLETFLDQIEYLETNRPMVLFVMGPPNVGKTTFSQDRLIPYLDERKKILRNQVGKREFEYTYWVWDDVEVEVRKEIDNLKKSRNPRLNSRLDELVYLLNPNDDSFLTMDYWRKKIVSIVSVEYKRNPPEFLEIVGQLVKVRALDWCNGVQHIKKRFNTKPEKQQLLIIELPGPSAFPVIEPFSNPYKIPWDEVYNYYSQVVAQVASPEKDGGGNANVAFLGIVAGPGLFPYMKARQMVLDRKRQGLDYEEILKAFGEHVSATGGTVEQILPAWEAAKELYERHKDQVRELPEDLKELLNLPEQWLRGFLLEDETPKFPIATPVSPQLIQIVNQIRKMSELLQEPIEPLIKNAGHMIAQALLMEYIATHFADQSCIVYNNPELSFDREEAIKKFFKENTYYTRNQI